MGMEMSAYVLAEQTEEGYKHYKFAPKEQFEKTYLVDLEWYNAPTFRLTQSVRCILSDVLQVSFENATISFSKEEAVAALEKLKAEERSSTTLLPNRFPALYAGLIEFFEICIANNYKISAT